MNPEIELVYFSWAFIAVITAVVAVPILRGRQDILSTRNLFLLGAINFVGIAGLKAGYYSQEFRVLDYRAADYHLFMLGAVVFFGALLLFYHFLKFPRKIAGRTFRKWPPQTNQTLILLLLVQLAIAILVLLPIPIPGVRQLLFQIGSKSIFFAAVFATVAWSRQKTNLMMLAIFVLTFLTATVIAVMIGGGRRMFLGVLMAVPVSYYWLQLRYKSPMVSLAWLSGSAAITILVLSGYSQVRHFDRRGEKQDRNATNSLEAISKIPEKMLSSNVSELGGQNAAQIAMAAINLYTTTLEPKPFHSLYFTATIYVPRQFWPDKPAGLGKTLPQDAKARGTRATWGPNIIGHGFHEGGLHMLVFYAFLAAISLRFFDELLARQPSNLYLLGILVSSSGHIIGWTRGDIGTFTNQIIASVAAGILFALLGRLLFGVGVVYPMTDAPGIVRSNLFAMPNRWAMRYT